MRGERRGFYAKLAIAIIFNPGTAKAQQRPAGIVVRCYPMKDPDKLEIHDEFNNRKLRAIVPREWIETV